MADAKGHLWPRQYLRNFQWKAGLRFTALTLMCADVGVSLWSTITEGRAGQPWRLVTSGGG